jgi:hypothetical protein
MFLPQQGPAAWPKLSDELTHLALEQDCLEQTLATIKRLREIVVAFPLAEHERQTLLYQLSHIRQHLEEAVNALVTNASSRTN